MEYEKLYDGFLKLFPNDKTELQRIAATADADPADGMHIMFGMVVIPFVMELLTNGYEEKAKAAFEYFERMATEEDPMISEVLEFTILEDIISRGKNILEKCKTYMGEKTLESCKSVEKYMM